MENRGRKHLLSHVAAQEFHNSLFKMLITQQTIHLPNFQQSLIKEIIIHTERVSSGANQPTKKNSKLGWFI